MRSSIFTIAVVFILGVMLAGCGSSNDVVSDSWIQKRKYRKGFFVQNLGTKARINKHQESEGREHLAEVETMNQERLPVFSLRPGDRTIERRPPVEERERTSTVKRAIEEQSNMVLEEERLSNVFIETEEEEKETPEALAMVAKILAAMSGLLAIGTFIAFLVVTFSAAGATSTAWFVLGMMAAIAILGILTSLVISYIIYEKYDDDGPMQWTLFSSYIFEAILGVLFYVFFIGLN